VRQDIESRITSLECEDCPSGALAVSVAWQSQESRRVKFATWIKRSGTENAISGCVSDVFLRRRYGVVWRPTSGVPASGCDIQRCGAERVSSPCDRGSTSSIQ
jgi:hypothetical protein